MEGWKQALICLMLTTAFNLPNPYCEPGIAQAITPVQSKGWALYQTSPHTGSLYVYFNAQGMAVVIKDTGCTVVTRAPHWNVAMYNNKSRVYHLSTLSEFKRAMQGNSKSKQKARQIASHISQSPPRKAGVSTIAGIKAIKYVASQTGASGIKRAEIWAAADMEAPSALTELIGKIYGYDLSNVHGMPLKVSYVDEHNQYKVVVSTLKCQPQVISVASFTYPATYKRVDSELEVLMDAQEREAMISILDDLNNTSAQDEPSSVSTRASNSARARTTRNYTNSSASKAQPHRQATTVPGAGSKNWLDFPNWWTK